MLFSEAFDRLRGGFRIRMKEWSPGTFLLSRKIPGGILIELYMDEGTHRVTWSPTQRELLADWDIAPEPLPQVVRPDGLEFFKSHEE